LGLVAITIVGGIMCNCVEIIKRNREIIVEEAIKNVIIASLVSKVKDMNISVVEDGTIKVELSTEIDERVTQIAFKVVDIIIELLEKGGKA